MTVSKAQLVEMLRARGDHALADRLNSELPATVDPAEHLELFRQLDLDLDAGDAARHADVGHHEAMTGLPESNADPRESREGPAS